MTAFLFYLLKVIVCSGVLFFYYLVALRNRSFHQWNRFYLLASVALSLILPLLQITIPTDKLNPRDAFLLLQRLHSANEYLEEIVITTGSHNTVELLFWTGYAMVCIVVLALFLNSLVKVFSLIGRHSFENFRQVRLTASDAPGTPFSFLHFIFWNKEIALDSPTGQRILEHELVHVKERHTLDKLFLQLLLSFFWSNPFFWLIRKELQEIHEFIADEKSVGAENASGLAALLLQTAYPSHFTTLTTAFFQTTIKRRLMMLSKKQSLTYTGRLLALPVVAALSLAFTVRSTTANVQTATISSLQSNMNRTDTIPTKDIQSVSVNKNDKNSTITITFKNGTYKTYTEDEARKEGLLGEKPAAKGAQTDTAASKPLYLVDGKEFTGDLNTIDANGIESINVLKDKAAADKYGDKGRNGAVEITLKKSGEANAPKNEVIIFEKTEKPASIEKQEWRAFLEKNLQPIIERTASKGAKPGKYTVNIRFIVNKDGSLSDFKALNDPGYDLASQILAVMSNSPKWNPAEQNGRLVNSYHTQPVTFVIQKQ